MGNKGNALRLIKDKILGDGNLNALLSYGGQDFTLNKENIIETSDDVTTLVPHDDEIPLILHLIKQKKNYTGTILEVIKSIYLY